MSISDLSRVSLLLFGLARCASPAPAVVSADSGPDAPADAVLSDAPSGVGGAGVCVAACATARDCCDAYETLGCQADFLHTWECVGGLCQHAQCTSDAQCSAAVGGSTGRLWHCQEWDGTPECTRACNTDDVCGGRVGNGFCTVTQPSGVRYCETRTLGCLDTPQCGARGYCDRARYMCRCDLSRPCGAGWRCVP